MSLVEDTLEVWREAERVLKTLPPLEPDHETVRMLVIQLREMYSNLSRAKEQTGESIAHSHELIASAREQLRSVRFPGRG